MKKFYIIFIFIFVLYGCTNIMNSKDNINKYKNKMENFNNQFFSQIGVKEFKKELEDKNKILIDVRTPGELPIYGKIRNNQLLIDINNPNFINNILKLDKNKEYLIYCWHGNRSEVARNFMQQHGFSYVKDLKGGINEWVKEGEKVIK